MKNRVKVTVLLITLPLWPDVQAFAQNLSFSVQTARAFQAYGLYDQDSKVHSSTTPPEEWLLSSESAESLNETGSTAELAIKECLLCRDYGKLLSQDIGDILSSPAGWKRDDWLTVSLGTLVVGVVALLDKPIRDGVQRNRTDATDNAAKIFERFGAEYSFGVLGGFYLAGVAYDDRKPKTVTQDGLAASLIASGIITPALQVAVGRSRPSQTERTYGFRPFGRKHSFPSGHATQAFAVASTVAAHYDPLWVKLTAYGVATSVGLARVDRNAHFASDVAAGALIGAAVGNAVVHFNQQYRTRISFGPRIDHDTYGMAIGLLF